MKPQEVTPEVIRQLARVAGIVVPDEDVQPLVGAFKNHLTGMQELDRLDFDEFDPIETLDSSWPGEDR